MLRYVGLWCVTLLASALQDAIGGTPEPPPCEGDFLVASRTYGTIYAVDPDSGLIRGLVSGRELRDLNGKALAASIAAFGEGSEQVAHHRHSLAVLLESTGKLEEAEAQVRQAIAIRESEFPDGHPQEYYRYVSQHLLGDILRKQRRFDEAEPVLLDAFDRYNPPLAGGLIQIRRDMLESIIALYDDWEAADPGAGHADDAAAWRERSAEASTGP